MKGKKEILSCLQEAVNAETTSRNLYWSRSVFWASAGFDRLAEYYMNQSGEDHAKLSADQMAFLGKLPAVEPTGVKAIADDAPIADQFNEDLEVETALADSYAEWIAEAAELKDYVTEDLWRGVLKSTQDHVRWLEQQVGQVELLGESVYLESWQGERSTKI